MRRWLLVVLLFLLGLPSYAQTIPITGHVGDASEGIPPGLSVKFELYNCGGNYPRVVGVFGIVRQQITLTPNALGVLAGAIVPNDRIDCGGITGTTRYNITILNNGIPQVPTACYAILSSMGIFNLDTATPCSSATPPPPPGGPYDGSFFNLNVMGLLSGGNAIFSGTVQAHQFLLDFTPQPCPSGSFITGLTSNFTALCAAPPSAPTLTVFGRTSPVTAQTGDYTCSQVTGALCTLPTLNYQTVQVAGTAQPQRGALNLLGSGGTTVSCVDNPGANSTDCTVAASAGGTPMTCNGNGCYRVSGDGVIEQWGVSGVVGTGGGAGSVTVTFPRSFTTTSNLSVTTSPDNCSGGSGCGGNWIIEANPIGSTLTTSSVQVYISSGVPVGGGGGTIANPIHANWRAIGH